MENMFAGLLPESLVIDLPEVDAQHEEIFIRIESLKAACFEIDYDPIGDFESLLHVFELHFATEERIAQQNGLEFSEHSKVHRISQRMVHKALDEVRAGVRDAYSFLWFIELWFERHINELDKPFATSLQAPRRYRSASIQASASF